MLKVIFLVVLFGSTLVQFVYSQENGGGFGSPADAEIRGANGGGIDLPGPSDHGTSAGNSGNNPGIHSETGEGRPDVGNPGVPAPPSPRSTSVNPSTLDVPATAKLTLDALKTISTIAIAFYDVHGTPLHVTSGSRTPHQQAEAMYEMLTTDLSQHHPFNGIDKYHDKTQARAIKNAFDGNVGRDKTIHAIEIILSECAAAGHPISNHMTEKGAADIRTQFFSSVEKQDLFRICRDKNVHCIYEVPAKQRSNAERLAKQFGVLVREAPVEHLHIDATVNATTMDSTTFKSTVPDLLIVRHMRADDKLQDVAEKWFQTDNDTWIERLAVFQRTLFNPIPHQGVSSHIWKSKGTQKIDGITYTRFEDETTPSGLQEKPSCFIPALFGTNSILTKWQGGESVYIPTPLYVKHYIEFPSDDFWLTQSLDIDRGNNFTLELQNCYTAVGDSVAAICQRYQMSVPEFMAINPELQSPRLFVGQPYYVWAQSK